jgi:hypothetical protein
MEEKQQKTWSKFTKVWKKFDIFGAKMNFRINSKKEHKSIFGGVTTIFFFTLSLIYILINFKDFVQWNNMNLIFTNKILEGDPFINLTKSEFAFAFGLQFQANSTDATKFTTQYFDYTMNVVQWVGADNITRIPIKLKKCTVSDFFNVKPELFAMNGIPDMFCPDISEGENFTVAGLFTDVWFQFLELNIKIKPEVISNLTSLTDFMNRNPLFASVFFLDTGIDYDNITTPLPNLINYYYTSVSPYDYKFTDIFLSTLEFIDDKNLLFQTSQSTIDTIYDRTSEYSVPIPDREELAKINSTYAHGITKFIIKASPKYFIVERTYQKIPEFLANMSGIISQILFLLMVTINYTNRKSAENKIMSDVLKYKGKKNFDIKYLTEVFRRNSARRKKSGPTFSENIEPVQNTEKNVNLLTLNNNNVDKRRSDSLSNDILENKKNSAEKNENLEKNKSIKADASFLPKIQNYSHISDPKIIQKQDEDYIVQASAESRNSQESNSSSSIEEPQPIIPYIVNPLRFRHSSLQNNLVEIEKKKRLSKHTTKLSITSFTKKKDIEIDKEMTNKLFKLNTLEILLIKLRCCCLRFRKRKRIVKAGEYKFFFYLDVLTYIKKMQEVDILKYLILSADQLYLFNFLSKPSISTNDITSMVYTEFQTEQKRILTLTKDEIHRMQECYKNILGQESVTHQDKKLINLVDAEIDTMRD